MLALQADYHRAISLLVHACTVSRLPRRYFTIGAFLHCKQTTSALFHYWCMLALQADYHRAISLLVHACTVSRLPPRYFTIGACLHCKQTTTTLFHPVYSRYAPYCQPWVGSSLEKKNLLTRLEVKRLSTNSITIQTHTLSLLDYKVRNKFSMHTKHGGLFGNDHVGVFKRQREKKKADDSQSLSGQQVMGT